MFKLLCFICGVYLNILDAEGVGTQKLIIKVNGRSVLNESIKLKNMVYDIRHKNITAGNKLNITCEIDGNELDEPVFSFKKDRTSNYVLQKDQCYKHPCKSISIQTTPPPGSVLMCKTNSTNKVYNFILIFVEKLPFVTVAINGSPLAVGPEQIQLTYKFNQNEDIVARCTHNTKVETGIWNFSGLSSKENVIKINETAVKIRLSSELSHSYMDCEDRSDCDGGTCQPAFIRVTFIYKDFLKETNTDDKINMIWITNNDDGTTINTTKIFHYKENDMMDLTCFRKPNIPFRISWYKDNTKLNDTHNTHLSLKWDNPLEKKDDGIEFKCALDEELGNLQDIGISARHYESIIKLQYDDDVTTPTPTPTPTSILASMDSYESNPSDRYILIIGLVTLLSVIFIVLLVVLILRKRSKKHKSEDMRRLQTPNVSIKSLSFESQVHMSDTYSRPRDADQELPADNNYDIDKEYSTPFSETKEIYALPVPKKFRTQTNMQSKAVVDVSDKNQYYSYAKIFKDDPVRPARDNINRGYENVDSIHGQSSMYSEIK